MDPREQNLVRAARAGDTEAFTQLYEDNYQQVYALAYEVLRERNTAAGVLRDTFAAAWTRLDAMPEGEPFSRWVLRLCSAQCDAVLHGSGASQWLDNAAALELLTDADPETFRLPQPYLVQPELMARLDGAVAALPERQRRALTLYYHNGLSLSDAADVLGTSPARVKSDLARARREIVRRLRDEEEAAGEAYGWTTERETRPFRAALAAQLGGVMLTGGAAGLLLKHVLASLTGGGSSAAVTGAEGAAIGAEAAATTGGKVAGAKAAAAAGGKAAATVGGKLAAMSTTTKIIAGVTAAAVVAGGYGIKKAVDNGAADRAEPVEETAPLEGAVAAAASVRVLDTVEVYDESGERIWTESYDYDENSYIISARGGGENDFESIESFEYSFSFDEQGRAREAKLNGGLFSAWDYNESGQLTKKHESVIMGYYISNSTSQYVYDAEGNLTELSVESFSEDGPSSAVFSCDSTTNADGGVDLVMTPVSGDVNDYSAYTESYDADGRLMKNNDYSYQYHEEKSLTWVTITDTVDPQPDSIYPLSYLALTDSVNMEYRVVFLGYGADVQKTYDDDGYLTRLDFSDGSHAEFTYRDPNDEPEPEPEPSPEPADTRWKQAYKDYLTDLRAEDPAYFDQYYSFALIYVNDDDIPELVIHTGVHAGGGILCTCDDGEVVSESISAAWNADYLERENRFLSVYGISGVVIHDVYEIRNGRIVKIASGTSYPDPNDPNAPTDHPFVWNEEDVTQEEYDARLNQAIDTSRTKTTGGAGFPVGSEVFDYIDRF